jgi:hypothetical protein
MASPDGRARRSVLSRRSFLVLGGLTTAAVVTDSWITPAAFAATAQLSLDFENNSLGAPITGHKGATLGPAYAHTGSYGCRLDPTTTYGSLASLTVDRSGFALSKPYAVYSMWFRLVTLPKSTDTYMNLFEIGNTSTASVKSQFTVFFKNNRLVCDFGSNETMDVAPVPTDSGWHQIQAIVYFGSTTYTAQVSYDGAAAKTLTSANNKTAESVKILWIHYPNTAVDYTMDVDDVLMSTSDTQPAFFFPPGPPPPPPGVTPFSESFEGGSVGAQPGPSNTSYDQTIGATGDNSGTVAVVFDAGGFKGQCARFYNTVVASSTFGFLGKPVGQQPLIYFRRYYKLEVLPQYRTSVLLYKWGGTGNGQVGGTHNGSFAFGGGGQSHKFTLVNKDTNSTLSRFTVPVNQWFRVETKLDFTSGSGVQTARLFLGSNVNGTTPDEELTGGLAGTYTDYVEDGILTNPNVKVNVQVDEVANGAGWLGPAQ